MLTPQDLIEMRKMVAASALVQGGAFKEELDRIMTASTELDLKMGVVKTMAEADAAVEALQKDLDVREAAVRALEERTLESAKAQQEISARLDARKKVLDQQEASLSPRLAKLAQDENAMRKAEEEAHAKEAEARRSQVGTGERAEKIRTYNFPENRVTDHRIKLTVHQLQPVLEGDIDTFVDALLARERAEQLGAADDSRS